MKKIVVINGSPRTGWNTGTLVREAAKGAESEGTEVKIFDLYKLEKITGCISCFGCKLPENLGTCVYKDGLSDVLEELYDQIGYDRMLSNYQNTLSWTVGPTKVMISGDTLQVKDYSRYDWTMFDPEAKKARHDEVFTEDRQKAFMAGAQMVSDPWK